MKNKEAIKLLDFLRKKDAFVSFPGGEADVKEWFALLDNMGIPFTPPSARCIQSITDHSHAMQILCSLVDTMDNWKSIMTRPLGVLGRDGKTYFAGSWQVESVQDKKDGKDE
jgi:hypothetical protein